MDIKARCLLPLLTIAALSLVSPHAFGAAYKWTDAEGNVHYGQHPPPQADAESVRPPPPPPAGTRSPASVLEDLHKRSKASDEASAKRTAEQQEAAKKQAVREENCRKARANLETYTRTRRIWRDGTVVRLTDEEWLKKLEEARKHVSEFCD